MMERKPDTNAAVVRIRGKVCTAVAGGETSLDHRVKAILDFIDSYPIDAVSLDSAAAVVRISPSRLRHLFKQHVGTSFHQYVMSVRLEHARHLLRTTNHTVEQVAAALGIQDRCHFGRIFKRFYGVSPGATRIRQVRSKMTSPTSTGWVAVQRLRQRDRPTQPSSRVEKVGE